MNCETCGNPIDRADAERGSCGHCGAVLAHVLRAAEKAELVRRVVAQGNDVRIDGDRIEARPPGPPREGPDGAIIEARSIPFGVAAAVGITLAAGLYSYFGAVRRAAPPDPAPAPSLLIAAPDPKIATTVGSRDLAPTSPTPESVRDDRLNGPDNAIKDVELGARRPGASRPAPPASPKTADGVVAANKSQYDRCQRDELARNPSAARRYSVAITVDAQGRAEWVEVLSEASAAMRSCIQSVTRGLDFPKPAAGSSRSIVTLSLAGAP